MTSFSNKLSTLLEKLNTFLVYIEVISEWNYQKLCYLEGNDTLCLKASVSEWANRIIESVEYDDRDSALFSFS